MNYAIQILHLLSIIFLAAGSYIWIRAPWWMTNDSISKISAGDKELVVRSLVSQRSDSRVAFFLIVLGTLSELISIVLSDFKAGDIFFGILKLIVFFLLGFLLYFIGNKCSRKMEESFLKKK